MAHEMLGQFFGKAVLELNASDDRGIDVVRNRIKQFAETRCVLPPNRHKIIVLDEVDNMTDGAQQALRRIMEKYASTTRFVLACNQSDKVIGEYNLKKSNFSMLYVFRTNSVSLCNCKVYSFG